MNALNCDLCEQDRLHCVYLPQGSARGLKVYVCDYCGLVQSYPRKDRVSHRPVAVSADAQWGNIRYGKGFRAKFAHDFVDSVKPWDKVQHCVDVGASRGKFIAEVHRSHPHVVFTAIEPEQRLVADYAHMPGVTMLSERGESADIGDYSADVIHCSHTLEHVKSAYAMMMIMRQWLKPDGLLYLEVPDIRFIDNDDVIEEWFIDKHLYHFSTVTLMRLCARSGFEVVKQDISDGVNLTYILKRSDEVLDGVLQADDAEIVSIKNNIAAYQARLKKNREGLRQVAQFMEDKAQNRVVGAWGGGRILDSLVVHGGLNTSCLEVLIDKHLSAYVDARHGISLSLPDEKIETLDILFVLSRAYADEIAREAKRYGFSGEIITWPQLVEKLETME